MMAQVNISIDDTLKAQGEELFKALGLSFSSAVSVFVAQAVRLRGLPFDVVIENDPFYSEENLGVLRESIKAADEGKVTEHELVEA